MGAFWSSLDRLLLLKTTPRKTHIISCPFGNVEGVAVAKAISLRYENCARECCYYPNEDCPQCLDISWLKTWQDICDNTAKTAGTVFVVPRLDR